MKESNLTLKIRKTLEREFPGSHWMKIAGGNYQVAGLPDLIGCVNGRFIGIEVKLPHRQGTHDGGVTALQQDTIDCINAAGGFATVAYGVDVVDKIKGWLKSG